MSLQGKRLLLLGGSNSIDDIRRFADHHGITLIATAHPRYGVTPLKAIADESYDVNAIDEVGLIDLIRDKRIDGIYPGNNEDIMPHAIAAAEGAGLPVYCSADMWDNCANKAKFKAMCTANGIPVAGVYDPAAPENIPYPVAVKPADSCGSQGFSICRSAAELPAAVENARKFSRTDTVLVEDFIPYNASIIHYTLVGGEAVFSGISDKKSMLLGKDAGSVMALQQFPSVDTDAYLRTLDKKVRNMFANNHMHDGPLWIEAFNDHGHFIFNEIGYRFGGSMTYHPVRYFYHFDQLEFMLRYALGEKPELTEMTELLPCGYPDGMHYSILPLHVHPGSISKILGESEVNALPNLYTYVPIHFVGDTISGTGTVHQVFCYLHILYKDMNDLQRTVSDVMDTLKVYDAEGRNLLFRLYEF